MNISEALRVEGVFSAAICLFRMQMTMLMKVNVYLVANEDTE